MVTYPLSHPLDGWHAALTSGGHQVVHRTDPDTKALHVGYAGHNITDAEQRLGSQGGESTELPVHFHPRAEKDLDDIHHGVQDEALDTISRLARREPAPKDHLLVGPLQGWRAARIGTGQHRVTHRYEDDEGNTVFPEHASRLYVGHIGAHNYGDAIRRLTSANGWHQDPDHAHVSRGMDIEPDGGWHPEAAHRILSGTATHEDLLHHINTDHVGHYWSTHNASDPSSHSTPRDYAEPHEPMANWTRHAEPGENVLGAAGVVLIGHRPHGWNPDDNPDEGLMGNSYLPDHSHIPLHEIHYSGDGETWHTLTPPAGTTVHTDGPPHTATSFFRQALTDDAKGDPLTRGLNVNLPNHIHQFVHDETQPLPARAHMLLSELKKPTGTIDNEELPGSSGGVGEFWTRNRSVSDDAAAVQQEQRPDGQRSTTVTLHARHPGTEHFWSEMAGGHGDDYPGNWRVPLRPGTPVGVHAITWGEPGSTQHHYDFTAPVDKQAAVSATAHFRQTAGVDDDEHLDLYHRTTPEAAAAIYRDRRMHSKENLGGRKPLYFSTFRGDEEDAQGRGYGEGVVHVRVPHHIAEIDDEFSSGEEHYSIDAKDLKPEHFVEPTTPHTAAAKGVDNEGHPVELDDIDGIDGWQHSDGSVSHDDGTTISDHPVKEAASAAADLRTEAAAVDNSDGVMIAFRPPREIAEQIAQDGGQPVDDLHITLAYLGNASSYTREQLAWLPELVGSWAARQKPVTIRIGGRGTFNNPGKDQHVLVALPDIPGGAQLHADLAAYLTGHGYRLPSEHGWTAHMSLAYVDAHHRFMPKLAELSWTATDVSTEIRGKRTAAVLGSGPRR